MDNLPRTQDIDAGKTALVIVDMQRSYLDPESDTNRMSKEEYPNSKDYIFQRSGTIVIPNIQKLLAKFRSAKWPVVYLRYTGTDPDRKDLHRHLRRSYEAAKAKGYGNTCALESHPMSQIVEEIAPLENEKVIIKRTYSPFTETDIDNYLKSSGVTTLAMTGLITSQCVETTARDGSDHGYGIIQIEDAQTDFDQHYHDTSLQMSQGVCGGVIMSTDDYLKSVE